MSVNVIIYLVAFVIATIVVLLIKYLKTKSFEAVRAEAYKLMLKAECLYKQSKMGQQKFNWVLDELYERFPIFLRLFISREDFTNLLQKFYNDIKDYLDDGKRNKSTTPKE